MRVDFERTYLSSEADQNWLRMMRGARAVAASIVIAAVGVLTFSSSERAPVAPLIDATRGGSAGGEFDRGVAANGVAEPIESIATPTVGVAPASAEEWRDPTLSGKETTGLLG